MASGSAATRTAARFRPKREPRKLMERWRERKVRVECEMRASDLKMGSARERRAPAGSASTEEEAHLAEPLRRMRLARAILLVTWELPEASSVGLYRPVID